MKLLRTVAIASDTAVGVITGAPGVGKTRLAAEVATRAQRVGARVGVGRAWGEGGAPPLWPWQTILRDVGISGDLLGRGMATTAQDRFARFAAVLERLGDVASSAAPLVIVLDDVHLADEAALLLVYFIMREQRGLPLLFVLTRRDEPEAISPGVRGLLGDIERNATTIGLHGLPLAAIRTYLTRLGVRSLPPDVLHAVASVTGGNPLQLRQVATRCTVDGDVAGALGRGMEDVVARLQPPGRRIVAVAALLGPEATNVEVRAVSDASADDVGEALSRAEVLGLLEWSRSSTISFVHDLVRQTVLSTLSRTEKLDLHARAARALKGSTPEQMLRRTHHALEAASRSVEDGEFALRAARDTAGELRAAGGLEAAAGLLHRAFRAHVALGLPIARSPLAVEYAESVLACGRLAEARQLFDQAAKLAESEDDALSLARAALGMGGIWLSEHRLADDTARVSGLQRRALASLPVGADVLQARLQARLATEDAYRGVNVDRAHAAIDAVRATGDAHARSEALSLYHHVLAGPEHAAGRLAIADEIIASAAESGDALLTLIGLCWRAADLFLLGDDRGWAALEEVRLRAEALQCRSILFVVRAMEVMLAIRAGCLADAESAAERCYSLGLAVGDVDALAYYGGHLAAIRVLQGREAELAEFAGSIAASPTLIPQRERSFAFAAALFALRGGVPGAGAALLDQFIHEGAGALMRSSSWLTSMLAIVELAAALRHETAARRAYEALLPFAERPAMASLVAVVCFGSTHRLLGVAASTWGDHDRAVEHLTAAVSANERLGHLPATIQARAELGLALVARAIGDDSEHGCALVEDAITAAEAIGMGGLARRWRASLEDGVRARSASEVATVSPAAQPGYWRVGYGGQVAIVADRVGIRYLEQLLTVPNQSIPAIALVVNGQATVQTTGEQPLLDHAALRALRLRIADLRQRGASCDDERDELDTLTRELGRALGLGGRSRTFVDAAERARTAVRKAIRRALAQIATANPAVGQHLASSVSTGAHCCYRVWRHEPRAADRRGPKPA